MTVTLSRLQELSKDDHDDASAATFAETLPVSSSLWRPRSRSEIEAEDAEDEEYQAYLAEQRTERTKARSDGSDEVANGSGKQSQTGRDYPEKVLKQRLVRNLRKDGWTLEEIAAKAEVGVSTVQRWLKSYQKVT